MRRSSRLLWPCTGYSVVWLVVAFLVLPTCSCLSKFSALPHILWLIDFTGALTEYL